MTDAAPLAGILLTGGASRRMGFDKAGMLIDGEICALRLARLLCGIADPVIEVGGHWTGLPGTVEEPPGSGPLAAIAAGRELLLELGHASAALVVACDLPRLTTDALALLASQPGEVSVVPLVDGREQPLCARWSARDLDAAGPAVAAGERSLRSLPDRRDVLHVDAASGWTPQLASAFRDADSPADLDRLGVRWRQGVPLLAW